MLPIVTRLYRSVHRHFVGCLVGAYAVGILWPEAGLWIRGAGTGGAGAQHGGLVLKVMLGLLLLNAGLGVDLGYLRRFAQRWSLVAWGVVVGLAIPLAFVMLVGVAMRLVPLPADYHGLLAGLAIVAVMPVAGSSTAWSQNAEGNLPLSLGLLLGSTIVSPLTALAALRVVAALSPAEAAQTIEPVLSHSTATFLTLWVLIPAGVGMLVRWLLGAARIETAKPYLKLANLVNLLVLNYANASLSLPSASEQPDALLWFAAGLLTVGLAVVAFGAGEVVTRWRRADRSERSALWFACGMKNNGAALVLASTALAHPGIVLVPILLYNLVQHLAAGLVDRYVLSDEKSPADELAGHEAIATSAEPGPAASRQGVGRPG